MSKLSTNAKKTTSKPFYRLQKKIVSRAPGGIRKARRRSKPRMRDCLLGIMHGKVFKQLMAMAMGRRPEVERPRADDTESGNAADVESSERLLAPNPNLDNNERMSRDTTTSENAPATVPIEQSTADEPMEDIQPAPKPPLTARYLDIFPHTSKDDSPGSAMSLTRTLIWQLNTVFRCENKLQKYASQLSTLDAQLTELDGMLEELHTQVSQIPSYEDATEQIEALDSAKDFFADLENQRNVLVQKIQATEMEMRDPKADMYRDLKEVLSNNNLLEDISGNSDSGHVPWNQAPVQTQDPPVKYTPTPSEAQQYALEDAQHDIRELKMQKEIKLQDARAKIETWGDHYDKEYREYKHLLDSGATSATKTEFDVVLLSAQREATRALITAEQEFEAAIQQARNLGVIFHDEDQESQFPDHADDGYRLSLENELVGGVDRGRIEKWMAEKEDKANYSTDCDDWDSRTVELFDSVSVVAEGKDRARIERWRALCEECRVGVLAGLDGGAEERG
jgi:hypothetical protein